MAGWPTHGNDCAIYPSLLEPERYVQDLTARSQYPETGEHESHYFSQQENQDDLHLGDKQACRLRVKNVPTTLSWELSITEEHVPTISTSLRYIEWVILWVIIMTFFYPVSEMPENVVYKQGRFALFLNAG